MPAAARSIAVSKTRRRSPRGRTGCPAGTSWPRRERRRRCPRRTARAAGVPAGRADAARPRCGGRWSSWRWRWSAARWRDRGRAAPTSTSRRRWPGRAPRPARQPRRADPGPCRGARRRAAGCPCRSTPRVCRVCGRRRTRWRGGRRVSRRAGGASPNPAGRGGRGGDGVQGVGQGGGGDPGRLLGGAGWAESLLDAAGCRRLGQHQNLGGAHRASTALMSRTARAVPSRVPVTFERVPAARGP